MDELNQAIDALIDEVLTEGESVEKSNMIKDKNPAKETADEAVKEAPKGEKDEKRDAGRPKQISDVPQTDTDGARSGEYDGSIAAKHEDAKKKEDPQVAPPADMKKSLTDAEFAEYQELKKAKEASVKAEELRKARVETADLIKSAVSDATAGIRKENEELKKSMAETNELIKAMANRPRAAKAVTSVTAVEKFQKSSTGQERLSKAEVLDVAEELVKGGKLTMEHVIELENTGYIFDEEAKGVLEREVRRKYS